MARRFVGVLVVLVVAGVFLYDQRLGIRALGVVEIAVGIYFIKAGKVPYGWRGFPASGYLTGWGAVASGLVAIVIGALFLVAPGAVEPLFCGRRGCT
jgi:hypothetical protein